MQTPIRLKLVSGECKVVSSLSRILGQYQINSSKFCLKFNEFSNDNLLSGVLFYVYIFKKEGRDNYEFNVGSPCLKILILNFLNINSISEKGLSFSIEELYDLYRIFLKLSKATNISAKTFLGSIQSLNVSVNVIY